MARTKFYQKRHGLPGISYPVMPDGKDGTNGSNVLFGYIGDFFDSIDITVDNLLRVAKKDRRYQSRTTRDDYYTGIRDTAGNDVAEYWTTAHYGKFDPEIAAMGKNIFYYIYENIGRFSVVRNGE